MFGPLEQPPGLGSHPSIMRSDGANEGAALQLKADSQRCVDLPEFVETEQSDVLAEAGGVHGGSLLDQHAGGDSTKQDFGAEACGCAVVEVGATTKVDSGSESD